MAEIRQIIDEIKRRIDLRDIIPIELRQGSNSYAVCPFHSDKEPSLWVHKDRYYCFGCQAKGDVINWLEDQKGLTFFEALEEAANAAGVELNDETRESVARIQEQRDQNNCSHAIYIEGLYQNQQARDYLSSRGISQEAIGYFQLGYDERQNAISIPIFDDFGRLQTFAYRYLSGEQRYRIYNSETWIKKDNLYNTQSLQSEDGPIYVAEGFFDVMSIWQTGRKRVVGMMGSQITDGIARKFPENSTVVFVPDAKKDSDFDIFKRALFNLKKTYPSIRTKVALLPSGDANSIATEELNESLGNIQSAEFAVLNRELERCEDTNEEYSVARSILDYVSDAWVKDDIVRYLSSRWGKEMSVVRQGINNSGGQNIEIATIQDALFRLEEEEQTNNIQNIHMGWGMLSHYIKRPRPGHIMLAAARSGVGKTMFALNYINKVRQLSIPTLFLSLEQPMTEIANRLAVMSSVNWDPITSDELSREIVSNTDRWVEHRDYTSNLFPALRICDKRLDGNGIRDAISTASYSLGQAVKVVIMDYVGLIKAGKHYKNRYEQASDICNEVQEIAKEMNVFIIGLYQLSREGKHGTDRVTIDMLRDSGVAEEVSDYIVGLWRDDPNKDIQYPGLQTMHLGVCKNRHGKIGEMEMYFNTDYLLIDEDERNMVQLLNSPEPASWYQSSDNSYEMY